MEEKEEKQKQYITVADLKANMSPQQLQALEACEPNPGADMLAGKDTSMQTKSDSQKNSEGSLGKSLISMGDSLMKGNAGDFASQGMGLVTNGINSMTQSNKFGAAVGGSLQVGTQAIGVVTNSLVGAQGLVMDAAAKADLIKNLTMTSVETFIKESQNMLTSYLTKMSLYITSMPIKMTAYMTTRTQDLIKEKTAEVTKNFTMDPEVLEDLKSSVGEELQKSEKIAKINEKMQNAKEKIEKATEKVSKGIEIATSYIDMGSDWLCDQLNTYIKMGLEYEGTYLGFGYKFIVDECDKFIMEQGEKLANKAADKAAKKVEKQLKKLEDKVKKTKAKAEAKGKAMSQKAILKLKSALGLPP